MATTFTFPRLRTQCLWLAGLTIVAPIVCVAGMRHTPVLTTVLLVGALYLFFAYLTLVSITTLLPLSMDDVGLSRRFLGRTWQAMAWSEVEEVVVRFVRDADNLGQETSVLIRPRHARSSWLRPHGKMAFHLDMPDPRAFREELNGYLSDYRIRVVDQRGDLGLAPNQI